MNLNSVLYQVVHPWHWITYGQNAAGIGLIVLVFYTIYTRRMMLLSQQTRRGELYPIIILQRADVQDGYLELLLMNVGAGPLLNAVQWGQQVSERFELGHVFLERSCGIEEHFVGTMISQANLNLRIGLQISEHWVLNVVEGKDSLGGRHQFCAVRRFVSPGNYEYAVRMIHPTDFLPFRRRIFWKIYELRARLRRKWFASALWSLLRSLSNSRWRKRQ